jgi:pimeloyl-ACP methyl ester carboxylesterase
MQTVTSADGTDIAYEREGDGPPLVLVHGGSATRHSWDPLRPHLADDFALFVLDRRGRGASGDADDYGLDREVADVRAVLESIDGDPILFGHSFGGLVALEVARETPVERLVLYEPALLTGDHRQGADLAARMADRLETGNRRDAVELFFREAAGVESVEQIPISRAVGLTETIVRENRAVERYRLGDDLAVSAPTLLFTGEHGPEHLRDGVQALHEELPDSRLVELAEAGHVGIASAPERVTEESRAFADES